MSGLLLGIGVAAVFDVAGVRNTATEMAARLGPGILEASSVSHHVFQKEEKTDIKMPLEWKLYYTELEFALKASSTAKRIPAGIYGLINPFNLADKVRGRILPKNVNKTLDGYLKAEENGELLTNTHVWSDAQESAPYRGAVAATASRQWGMEKFAYGAFDSLAVFWINSGNNAQGLIAVYNKLYHEAGKTIHSAPKRAAKALKGLVSDPFQLANIIACSVWYAGVLALRSNGVRLEEYGNLGAAVEASLIGIDTAVAVQIAKRMIYHRVADASKLDVSTGNLLHLSKKYGAEEMLNSLSDDKMPHRFMVYNIGNLVMGPDCAIKKIVNTVVEGVKAAYNFINRLPYV